VREACAVVWLEVRNSDLVPGVDPAHLLSEAMRGLTLVDAVGLLTSRTLATYEDVTFAEDGVAARCVATVGLGNALRAERANHSAEPYTQPASGIGARRPTC